MRWQRDRLISRSPLRRITVLWTRKPKSKHSTCMSLKKDSSSTLLKTPNNFKSSKREALIMGLMLVSQSLQLNNNLQLRFSHPLLKKKRLKQILSHQLLKRRLKLNLSLLKELHCHLENTNLRALSLKKEVQFLWNSYLL